MLTHHPYPQAVFPLPYATAAYELAPFFPQDPAPWTPQQVRDTLADRATFQKQRRVLNIYYYRIGHTLAFPLPLDHRPDALPAGIPGWTGSGRRYPWFVWLWWELEERWRVLQAAWRLLDDQEAGQMLQQEVAALDGWSTFVGWSGQVQLITGHVAACLALCLGDREGWEEILYQRALAAARRLLEQDVWPWYQETWADPSPLTAARLHNIPTIVLVRNAQLARTVGHPRAQVLEARARDAFHAWCQLRLADPPHTEGTAYDGYLLDSVTEWLAGLPDREALVADHGPALDSVLQDLLHLTLPGRPDLHAPLSDVEPEMPFWMTVLLRLARWRSHGPALWLARRLPLVRMPAAALQEAAHLPDPTHLPDEPPRPAPTVLANAAALRIGWEMPHRLAAISLNRGDMSHLHRDGGQVIIGWQGRFWITDPGYQQYRPGEERDFTLGVHAHNAPVFDGAVQVNRGGRLLAVGETAEGWQYAWVDITRCYGNLPPGASVRRALWLLEAPLAVVVQDELRGLPAGLQVQTAWHGGAYLAWAFCHGWARLDDGRHALWFGTLPGAVDPAGLSRHGASRGELTWLLTETLDGPEQVRWWIFCGDEAGSWSPPSASVTEGGLRLAHAGTSVLIPSLPSPP
ncbi:heparinase II/III domain-containing protein [Litorilinea aerophila]|uniref:Heparinase II/III-like C-terminal domain-containing protein n=1 Tax=Litorilinea aerophila TaxID=1204385 RepID=A0A540VL24_9CHLR|nr:heparinase II/III family protein [Litorilinea aerophila]